MMWLVIDTYSAFLRLLAIAIGFIPHKFMTIENIEFVIQEFIVLNQDVYDLLFVVYLVYSLI